MSSALMWRGEAVPKISRIFKRGNVTLRPALRSSSVSIGFGFIAGHPRCADPLPKQRLFSMMRGHYHARQRSLATFGGVGVDPTRFMRTLRDKKMTLSRAPRLLRGCFGALLLSLFGLLA